MSIIFNKINEIKQSTYVFICSILFILIILPLSYYWAKFGLDTTDTGFFLYSQNKINLGTLNETGPNLFWIGSDLLGSIWLKIIGIPSLHKARIAAYLLDGLIFFIIHFCLLNIIKDRINAIYSSFFSYLFFGATNIFPIINYDLAPLLPISLLFYILIRIVYKNEQFKSYYFFVGILLYVMIFMRLPLLFLALSFLLIFILQNKNQKKIVFFSIIIGFIFIQIIFLQFEYFRNPTYLMYRTIGGTFYKLLGYNDSKTDSLSLLSSNNYGVSSQIFYWLRGYIRIIIFTFLITFVLYFLLKKTSKQLQTIFHWALLLILVAFVFLPISKILKYNFETIQNQVFNIYLLSGLTLFFLFIFLLKTGIHQSLILFLTSLFFLFPLGSNSFEKKLILTFPLIIPALYFIFLSTPIIILNKKLNLFYKSLIWLSKLIFIPILIVTIRNYNNYPYKDSEISSLTMNLQVSPLKNIQTTKKRGDEIESVVSYLLKNKKSDSKILCVGRISIFNYLTNTDGIFDYPWPTYLNFRYFQSRIDIHLNQKNKLDFIVLPLYDVTQKNWEQRHLPLDFKSNYINYVINSANKYGYTKVYSTEYFMIMKSGRY
jgi:hypothetical protein